MKIAIRGGHNFQAVGASGFIDETTEDRKVKDAVIKYLKQAGEDVLDVTPGNCDQNTDLAYGVYSANSFGANLFASIHFNKSYDSYNGAIGTEVWIYATGGKSEPIATRIVNKISSEAGFKNRGVKTNANLYDLRKTNMPAMIIEVCFVEATEDVRIYREKGPDFIGKCIAEAILNNPINYSNAAESNSEPETVIDDKEENYMSKKYQNGSTVEDVFSDYDLTNKIGSLDPHESCEAIGDIEGRIVVLYNGLDKDGKQCKKTGFVKYRGGIE